jgi:hypothetical protein
VTPPPFRRSKCDAGHNAIAATRRIYLIALPNRGRDGSKAPVHKAVDDAVFMGCFASLSRILFADSSAKHKADELSICSLAAYQNEMLMPHCRHEFAGGCRCGRCSGSIRSG